MPSCLEPLNASSGNAAIYEYAVFPVILPQLDTEAQGAGPLANKHWRCCVMQRYALGGSSFPLYAINPIIIAGIPTINKIIWSNSNLPVDIQ